MNQRRDPPAPSSLPPTAAAAQLAAAHRVLVTGFVDLPLDAVAAACDVAEAVGAAVDAGHAESSRPAGPTIARAGAVTADREELRDRSDLVVFWFCDPEAIEPGFLTRFIAPSLPSGRERRTIMIGPPPGLPVADVHAQLDLDRATAVDAARVVQHLLLGGRPPDLPGSLAAACQTLHAAIDRADCVAFVTADAADAVGLEAWSMAHLVRTISHRKPAFEIPLNDEGTAGFRSCCTWRYGAAGAIAVANRAGGDFLPAEASACRLIERGEVDCVLVVGRAVAAVERAIADRGDRLTVVRIDERTQPSPAAGLAALRAAIASHPRGATR